MAVAPDIAYQKQREATLAYEDARFNSLMAGVPDYYLARGDYTLYGSILRALALELARLEYCYAYDVVSLDPQYLTPPDIKRRFAAPLFVNSSFPNSSQSDQEYKAMLVALLHAYPKGATLEAIGEVIAAYTGQAVEVRELYKYAGNGIYDETDRNALKVTLNVTGKDPTSEVISATQLATIAQDLYSAIDLAKPAHIGLLYSIAFGRGEDLTALIAAITDSLDLIYYGVEAAPLPEMLNLTSKQQYGDGNPTPDTRLLSNVDLTHAKYAGDYLAQVITSADYDNLMSDEFREEYEPYPYGGYSLIGSCLRDLIVVDSSGSPTGQIVKPQGVLAPQLERCWSVKSDALSIFRMS